MSSKVVEGTTMESSTLELVEDCHVPKPGHMWGARYTLALLGFLGFSSVYAMRVNLSVAIVAMVQGSNSANTTNYTDPSSHYACPLPDDFDTEGANNDGEFDWDSQTQGLILGSFFYGYTVTNLVGGRIAEYLGGKVVYGTGILLTSVLTLLSPLCARTSAQLFVAIRILEGITEGVTFPAMNSMLANWVPPKERAKFSTLIYAGVQFGTVVTLSASGWMCDSDFLGGWPSVFYVFGALGLVWSVAWFLLAFDNPGTHPRISEEEKKYIIRYCGKKRDKPLPLPWKAVLTSVPVWAVIVVHFGYNWGFYTLLTELPTYLNNIQHFDMKSNGLVSALPYLVMWIFSLIYCAIIDRVIAKGKISFITVRRLSMAIGVYGPMLGLIAMCFVNCDAKLAMGMLCVAVGFNGASYSGYMCSHQDLSPNLAGSLMGLTNAIANISGFVAPAVTGAITENNQSLSAWRTVFLISSATYLVSNTIYLIFISADVQPWNNPRPGTDAGQMKEKEEAKQQD
nr:putative inorganic phosphate cotransporter [Procambarus clarkii]